MARIGGFLPVRCLRVAWLATVMVWRCVIPTAVERAARNERLATRDHLLGEQRWAAAAFRWWVVQQRHALERDGARHDV